MFGPGMIAHLNAIATLSELASKVEELGGYVWDAIGEDVDLYNDLEGYFIVQYVDKHEISLAMHGQTSLETLWDDFRSDMDLWPTECVERAIEIAQEELTSLRGDEVAEEEDED